MYKLLLCWRYLRTRYIALASIVSVMLGVMTMIVVNAVMSGFTTEMEDRIHGILADVSFESRSLDGMADSQWHREQIRRIAGDLIEEMTPTVYTIGMLNYGGITRDVQVIGIDETTQGDVSDFSEYLNHPENRRKMSFELHKGGYDVRDHQAGPEAEERKAMAKAGWERRRWVVQQQEFERRMRGRTVPLESSPERDGNAEPALPKPADPFAGRTRGSEDRTDEAAVVAFDPAKHQHTGIVPGFAVVTGRGAKGDLVFGAAPGDDVKLTVPTVGRPPQPSSDSFTIVDLYESKMSEYDSKLVFVPIAKLQELRGMGSNVNSIQIKVKEGVDPAVVRDKLRNAKVLVPGVNGQSREVALFPAQLYGIGTWRDNQKTILSAVEMERAILNVLLFMIIAVAGFGILAIFLMIVVEKTRDIGILKSLGASGAGVMGIFVSYGLALGAVGSGVGLAAGLLFVKYINEIADGIGWLMDRPVFPPSVYYFDKIPTIVHSATVGWIVAGAMTIAVLASVLPALRAAMLHPVEALRYE
ncbi:MAG: ABC transporter permease [Candidatus Nealsonbacteria bacterium]|nr:ABC transporter permease [Candidatus Nealsonbacteria bacterium]